MKTARRVALDVLAQYRPGETNLSGVLNRHIERSPDTPDKGFVRDLVWGVVRYMNTLDWAVGPYLQRPRSVPPLVMALIRMGVYQIIFEHSRVPAYAAVSESAALANQVAPWATKLVNAVLRSLLRRIEAEGWGVPRDQFSEVAPWMSIVGAHPLWMVERWIASEGEQEALAICTANNITAPQTLRINTAKTSVVRFLSDLKAVGIEAEAAADCPEGVTILERAELARFPGYDDGHFIVQDEASQMVARLLDPAPGETIIDLCCGSGVKATHLAQLAGSRAQLTAVDIDKEKVAVARALAVRLGVSGITWRVADALTLTHPVADKVLVDAPCSGLGVIRRKPDIKWNRTLRDVRSRYPALQGALLDAAAPLTRPGGTLVYATCSTEPEENDMVLTSFIDRHPDFVGTYRARTWPHRDNRDGFFMAKFTRVP